MTQTPETCQSPDTISPKPGTDSDETANVAALIERLEKRAKEDESCAENSRVVAGLLAPEMAKFKARTDAGWNTYAVRLAVDHQNSIKRDSGYAADLRAVIALLDRAREVIKPFAEARVCQDGYADELRVVCQIPGSSLRDEITVAEFRAASRLHHEMGEDRG